MNQISPVYSEFEAIEAHVPRYTGIWRPWWEPTLGLDERIERARAPFRTDRAENWQVLEHDIDMAIGWVEKQKV